MLGTWACSRSSDFQSNRSLTGQSWKWSWSCVSNTLQNPSCSVCEAGYHCYSYPQMRHHCESCRGFPEQANAQSRKLTISRFVVSFFFLTYFLNRPCVYCSALLLILFISSCYWSDHCFFDIHSNWFEPRHFSSPLPNPLPQAPDSAASTGRYAVEDASFLATVANETAAALAAAAIEEVKRRMDSRPEWTGIGVEWIRSWLGAREWRLPCLDVYVRL